MKLLKLFNLQAAGFGRTLLVITLTHLGWSAPAHAANLNAGFKETRVATGLVDPVSLTLTYSDPRTFICERGGRVRIIKNGTLLATPFLTVSVNTSGDRGLFSMVLDNASPVQHVFVYYTAKTPTIHNRVSRFTVNQSSPDTVLAGSELVLLDLPTSANNFNNGGALALQNELFISTGDDGVPANAQSLNSPFGKILRISVFGEIPGTIPTDNPFYSQTTGINRAIWALGFRNPYPLTPAGGADYGSFVSHDLGNEAIEENLVTVGGNYGWPVCDGSCQNAGFTNPVREENADPQTSSVCAVKGAVFYNQQLFGDDCGCGPDYVGAYFYTGCDSIGIRHTNGGSESFAYGIDQPSGLGVDTKGDLWYLERGTGSVYRVTLDTPCLTAPTITVQPQPITVLEGARVTLSVQATSNSGCALSYRWYQTMSDDGPVAIPGAFGPTYSFTATSHNFSVSNTYSVAVSNVVGSVFSNEVFVAVRDVRTDEAETLPLVNSSGDSTQVINESGASAGAAVLVNSNAVNDQVTYQLSYVYQGAYSIKVRFKKASNRAMVQVLTGKVGGSLSNVGAPVDLYSATASYQEVTIGTWTAQSASDKLISFKVTGKNASSTGYSMCIDSVKLVPQ